MKPAHAAFLAIAALAPAVSGEVVTIPAVRDNTMYSESGDVSNGAGVYFFTGVTAQGDTRRALIAFDVAAAVPAGARITSATLRLRMSRTVSGSAIYNVHRVTAQWGEGTSDASSQEGMGAPATPNDATWTFRLYNTQRWTTPGGDYVATPSTATTIGLVGFYTFETGPQVVADVQGWLDNPATNYGWLIRADDETVSPSAKRFDSRSNTNQSNRPTLTIEYTTSCDADFNGDGTVDSDDFFDFLNAFNLADPSADFNGDGVVDSDDFFDFLNAFNAGC